MSAGKGDKPRNCFSKEYKKNYDEINWGAVSTEKLLNALKKYPEIARDFHKKTKKMKTTIKNNFIGI